MHFDRSTSQKYTSAMVSHRARLVDEASSSDDDDGSVSTSSTISNFLTEYKVKSLQAQVDELRAKESTAQSLIAELRLQNENLTGNADLQTKHVRELNAALKKANDQVAILRSEKMKLAKAKGETWDQLAEAVGDRENLRKELKIAGQVSADKLKAAELKFDMVDAANKAEIGRLNNSLARSKSELAHIRGRYQTKINQILAAKDSELLEAKIKISNLQNSFVAGSNLFHKLQQELIASILALRNCETELNHSNWFYAEKIAYIETRNQDLQNELDVALELVRKYETRASEVTYAGDYDIAGTKNDNFIKISTLWVDWLTTENIAPTDSSVGNRAICGQCGRFENGYFPKLEMRDLGGHASEEPEVKCAENPADDNEKIERPEHDGGLCGEESLPLAAKNIDKVQVHVNVEALKPAIMLAGDDLPQILTMRLDPRLAQFLALFTTRPRPLTHHFDFDAWKIALAIRFWNEMFKTASPISNLRFRSFFR